MVIMYGYLSILVGVCVCCCHSNWNRCCIVLPVCMCDVWWEWEEFPSCSCHLCDSKYLCVRAFSFFSEFIYPGCKPANDRSSYQKKIYTDKQTKQNEINITFSKDILCIFFSPCPLSIFIVYHRFIYSFSGLIRFCICVF